MIHVRKVNFVVLYVILQISINKIKSSVEILPALCTRLQRRDLGETDIYLSYFKDNIYSHCTLIL